MNFKKYISFIFPFYIILIYYGFGFGSIGDWLLIFFSFLSFKRELMKVKQLIFFISFIILYDLYILVYNGFYLEQSFYNREIFTIIKLTCILIISSKIDFTIFKKSIYLITVITSLGVIYHVILIYSGQSVSTISFYAFEASRFSQVAVRPLSIFPEPAAIVSFSIIPLYLLMNERKVLYSILLSIIILLSTSSTGIIYLAIVWSFFLYKSHYTKLTKLLTIFILSIIVTQYYSNDVFKLSSQKFTKEVTNFENQKLFEDNIRLLSGPLLFSTLSSTQILFGLRSSSIDNYVNNSNDASLALLKVEDSVFLPSFWLIWASYGLVGLILYLYIFFCFYKKNKNLAPLMVVFFVGMFIQKIAVGPVFIFYIIFLITENNYNNSKLIQ
jgi:hypothetical protein